MVAKNASDVVGRIRECRKKIRVTQVELASVVGISQPYLCKIEKGISRDVPLDLVMQILKELEIKVTLE